MKKTILKAYKPGTIIIGKIWLINCCLITGHQYSKRNHCIMYSVTTDTGMKTNLSYVSIQNIIPIEFKSYDTIYITAYEPGEYVYIKNSYSSKPKLAKIINICHDVNFISYTVQYADGTIDELEDEFIFFKYTKLNLFRLIKYSYLFKDIIEQEKQFKQTDTNFQYICNSKFIYLIKCISFIYNKKLKNCLHFILDMI